MLLYREKIMTKERKLKLLATLITMIIIIVALQIVAKLAFPIVRVKYPSRDLVTFYKKYSVKVNHLRNLRILSKENELQGQFTSLIYRQLKGGKTKVLIQGDSWAEQFSSAELSGLKDDFTVTLSGVTSYAPSPMAAQLDILVDEFGIKPELVVATIDQTDIGDELCRYRSKRSIDSAGQVTVAPFDIEKGDRYTEPYNSTALWEAVDILDSESLSLTKLLKVVWKNNILYPITHASRKKCRWGDISEPLTGHLSAEDRAYFVKTVDDYIKRVFHKTDARRLLFLTHFHKKHISGEYTVNVSNLIEEALKNTPYNNKVDHINITKENYGELYSNSIFKEGDHASHLVTSAHAGIYTNSIIDWLNSNNIR